MLIYYYMNIICEGTDALGKGTQIQLIKNEFERRGQAVMVAHYSNLKFSKDSKEIEQMSKTTYAAMFNIMSVVGQVPFCNLIFDRAHIGEVVYSPMYRGYSGNYVYGLEKEYLKDYSSKDTKLILFSDTAENVIARDKARGDGLSFTLDLNKKRDELKRFEDAVSKSKLNHKIIMLNGRTPEEIFEQDVKPYIWSE